MTAELLGQIAVIPGANTPIQYGICKITGSHCAHVIVCIGDNECIGAEPGGARIRPMTDYPTAIWSKFVFQPGQAQAIADYARAQEHKPYNYFDDAIIGLQCALHFHLPEWVTGKFGDDDSFECAQLADAALQAGGIQAFTDKRPPGSVFPGSFEFLFIRDQWYTAQFFESFPIGWGSFKRGPRAAAEARSVQGDH